MNNSDLEKMMKTAKEKTGVDIEGMKKAAETGKLDDFINKNLSAESTKKIKNVLSSKEAAEKLLASPQAKELIKKLTQDK